MTKEQIYLIFVNGIDFGIKYGVFPSLEDENADLFGLFESLTVNQSKEVKSVTYTVIVAGFNYGANLRIAKPDEEYIRTMFENLIQGKALETDDNMYYAIKEKIEKILIQK